MIDRILHAGCGLDQRVHIRGCIPKTVVDKDRCASDQYQLGLHPFSCTFTVFLTQRLQIAIYIVFGKLDF